MLGMWAIGVLAVLNVIAWGGTMLTRPYARIVLPGSYPYWWYDNIPWIAFALTIVSIVYALGRHANRNAALRGKITTILAVALVGFLPWACVSGAGA